MAKKILVLFDQNEARSEAIEYSVGLAQRTDSSIVLFRLLSSDGPGPDDGQNLDAAMNDLNGQVESVKKEGISVDGLVRTGDFSSELMKYFAESGGVQSIVWGGGHDLMDEKTRRHKSHWLLKIQDKLGCPVIVPSRKTSPVGNGDGRRDVGGSGS